MNASAAVVDRDVCRANIARDSRNRDLNGLAVLLRNRALPDWLWWLYGYHWVTVGTVSSRAPTTLMVGGDITVMAPKVAGVLSNRSP